ncbi:NHL repeat-containing protein [Thermodesulfobacteriota bacterium]
MILTGLLTKICWSKLNVEVNSVVAAIKDKTRQSARRIKYTAFKLIALTLISWRHPPLAKKLISFFVVCIFLVGGPAAASDFMVPVKSIAQISVDEENNSIDYPATVSFDPVMEEIYLVNGGKNRVVVYGPDFFPRVSIGIGRGIISPRGVLVMNNGDVYICQVKTAKNPRPRITILNGAFFVDREIFLDEIPEVENFIPRALAINKEGIIYLAGDRFRGILVMDNEGNLLRKLQPMDKIILRGEEATNLPDYGETPEGEEVFPDDSADIAPEEDIYADIPEEFRPRSGQVDASGFVEITGPVKINYVSIDSEGKIYLISAETGKIYVYGPDESFLFSFGTKGGSPGQQSNPRALVIDEDVGVIYVVDYMRHTILAYTMAGEYIFEFGGRGFNPGWFNFPNDIAINNHGQLIIADLFNRRVQVLEIGKEGISYYMDRSEEGINDAIESFDSEEFGPGESDDLDELYKTIKVEEAGTEGDVEREDEEEAEGLEGVEEAEGSEGVEEADIEIIFEEEVIEKAPPVQQTPLGPFDEPLETPEQIRE